MIPIEEQPYPLPDGWQWVTLDNVAECLDNLRSPVNATERAKRPGKIPYYGATGQVGWIDDFLTDEQLVLLGEDGAPFLDMFKDKAYIIEGKAWVNNHAHILRSRFGNVGNKFLCRYLNAFDFSKYVNGTTRLKLTQSKMKKIPIPLPPLDEQQRIVALLDELFADLDEAKALAQAVVDGSKLRNTAILHKAFTGELSKLWRDEHGTALNDWQQCHLSELLLPMQTKRPTGKIFRYIDIDSIDNDRQSVKAPKIIATSEAPSRASRAVESGNVLFSMVRPYLKNVAFIDESLKDCIASTGFFVCKCKANLLPKFLYRFLCFDGTINYLTQFMKGDNSPAIRQNEFLDTPINLPPPEEQKEIVRLLDDLLGREQRTKDLALKTLDRVELMKKSILARAFRGELSINQIIRGRTTH